MDAAKTVFVCVMIALISASHQEVRIKKRTDLMNKKLMQTFQLGSTIQLDMIDCAQACANDQGCQSMGFRAPDHCDLYNQQINPLHPSDFDDMSANSQGPPYQVMNKEPETYNPDPNG